MSGSRITIEVVGSVDDDGHPRLSDLIEQLRVINSALGNTERLLTGSNIHDVYFRVVDTSHNSPVRVVLEPVVKAASRRRSGSIAGRTVRKFMSNLRRVRSGRDAKEWDLPTLESYRKIAEPLSKNITNLKISEESGAKPVQIDRQFRTSVDRIIGPDELALGSVTGRLEWLNIHHNQNLFNVYPSLGPARIVCHFPSFLRMQVIGAIDQPVTVYGTLKYKQREMHPHGVLVDEIEIVGPNHFDLPQQSGQSLKIQDFEDLWKVIE